MSCPPLLPHHPPCRLSSVDSSQSDVRTVAFLHHFPIRSKACEPLPGTFIAFLALWTSTHLFRAITQRAAFSASKLPLLASESRAVSLAAFPTPGSLQLWDLVFASLLHSIRAIPHLICHHHISVPSIVSAHRRHSIYILNVYKLYLWYKKHVLNLPLVYHRYEDKINFLT